LLNGLKHLLQKCFGAFIFLRLGNTPVYIRVHGRFVLGVKRIFKLFLHFVSLSFMIKKEFMEKQKRRVTHGKSTPPYGG